MVMDLTYNINMKIKYLLLCNINLTKKFQSFKIVINHNIYKPIIIGGILCYWYIKNEKLNKYYGSIKNEKVNEEEKNIQLEKELKLEKEKLSKQKIELETIELENNRKKEEL